MSVAVGENGMFDGGPKLSLSGAVLFLNTMKDANPILNKINWTTYLVPTVSQTTINTIATDGTLNFTEFKTFNFYKYYNEAVSLLQSDPQSMVWVIKNIFIGFNDSDAPHYEADSQPYMFWMVDSTAKYTKEGGSYEMKFVGVANGVSKSSQLHIQAGESFTVKPQNVKKLSLALGQLAEFYNEAYQENRAEQIKLNAEYAAYKQIRYRILTDPIYDSELYKLDGWDIDDAGRPDIPAGSIMLHTNSIENGIHEVIKYCSQIAVDATNSDSKFMTYKIVSNTEFLDDEVVVTFKVVRFTTPTVTTLTNQSEQMSAAATVGQSSDHYVFKYLNTGQNVDVINFDINVSLGLVLMQHLHSAVPLQATITKTVDQNMAMHDGVGLKHKKPILTPTLMASKPTDRNRVFHEEQLTYQQALAKHAFVEGLESRIRIIGNPDLLGRFNTLPSEIISNTPDWATGFILCKIDVGIPTSTDHPGSFTYAEPFWYDGFYAMLSVEQIFEAGFFTQEIELMSLPQVEGTAKKDGHPDE